MSDRRSTEQLMELAAGRPAPAHVVRLYHQAFREFGALALWSWRMRCDARGQCAHVLWPQRSRKRAVPLSELQVAILRLLQHTVIRRAMLPAPPC